MRGNLSTKDFLQVTFKYKNLWGGLVPMQLLAIGAIAGGMFFGLWKDIYWLYLALGYFCIMMLGVTIGYHRYVSHRGFETWAPVKYTLLFFAMLAGQGSPVFWTATHRDLHHPYSDGERDPHTPQKGFFHSWFLWLWKIEEKDIDQRRVIDLLRDPFMAFTHKYYMYLYWAANAIIAAISIEFWIWFVVVPSFITFHSLSLIHISEPTRPY